MSKELKRLEAAKNKMSHWRRWGPYVSERQWGTVREDYSANGEAWGYFTHDQARSRAYRWGEDGIAGISDNHQRLCFGLAFWNENDAILKERLFGLTGNEGNHGEDVKEHYVYLDSTPTHSYMKMLYKYPHAAFPYDQLIEQNRGRSKQMSEFELVDTGIFDQDRYFDIFVEYAKETPEDILVRITIENRASEEKTLRVLPTLWFRNTWSWSEGAAKPSLRLLSPLSRSDGEKEAERIEAVHPTLGTYFLYSPGAGEVLFTENETNEKKVFNIPNRSSYVKDGINDYLVQGDRDAVNPNSVGTKAACHYRFTVPAQGRQTLCLRLSNKGDLQDLWGSAFHATLEKRQREADEFYDSLVPSSLSPDLKQVQRQAFAGMLWSKQFYYYVVEDWLKGDSAMPSPPTQRLHGRNRDWLHLYNDDILSMPDKWEYPWFAAWDLAFHVIPLAMVDPEFSKNQLLLLTREWYMHPNGQIPAYEWEMGNVNPPVQAWAAWRIYKIEQKIYRRSDRRFLERVFQKLLLNFTWWVNRQDSEGNNVFGGGFLGLDNIGVFDRSAPLPMGGHIEQSDGTSWMGMYSLNMLTIALELAKENPAYEDIASKFFEHFLYIADAINRLGGEGLWNDQDGLYCDVLRLPGGRHIPFKIHSMTGLIPLFAVETLEPEVVDALPGFKKRMEWFIKNRPDLSGNVASMEDPGIGERRLLSIVNAKKLKRILEKVLHEDEFFSSYGIRSLSKTHKANPYSFEGGPADRVEYEPAESSTGLFGGNSNWRGPIWFPVNFLVIESLQKFHHYFGSDYKVECPTGSGKMVTLWDVAAEISQRLIQIFVRDHNGRRAVFGKTEKFQNDPNFRDYPLFHEYFDGDDGTGRGASHQTGWTGLVAKLIQQCGEYGGKSTTRLTETE